MHHYQYKKITFYGHKISLLLNMKQCPHDSAVSSKFLLKSLIQSFHNYRQNIWKIHSPLYLHGMVLN